MARIRTIKPEFWTNAQIIECSTNARLLFIGLWNFCDDEGRHVFSAKQIKAQIFPSDDFSAENIHRMLDELSANDLIIVYAIDNIEYLQVTGWRHQKIDKPYKSKIPPPSDQYLRSVGECSENVRLKERKGKEESSIRIETPTSESKTKTRSVARGGVGGKPPSRSRKKSTGLESRRKIKMEIFDDTQPNDKQRLDAANASLESQRFRDEWRKFRDHHRAVGSKFLDWNAAWRTWISRIEEYAHKPFNGHHVRSNGMTEFNLNVMQRTEEIERESTRKTDELEGCEDSTASDVQRDRFQRKSDREDGEI